MQKKTQNILREEFQRLKDITQKLLSLRKKQPQLILQPAKNKKNIFIDGSK